MTLTRKIFFYLPTFFIIYFYVFCFGTTLYLGKIPSYGKPDPAWAINELIILSVYIFFLTALSSIVKNLSTIKRQNKTLATQYFLQTILLFTLIYFDPGGMREWFLD